jgi:hypothetical protein
MTPRSRPSALGEQFRDTWRVGLNGRALSACAQPTARARGDLVRVVAALGALRRRAWDQPKSIPTMNLTPRRLSPDRDGRHGGAAPS